MTGLVLERTACIRLSQRKKPVMDYISNHDWIKDSIKFVLEMSILLGAMYCISRSVGRSEKSIDEELNKQREDTLSARLKKIFGRKSK